MCKTPLSIEFLFIPGCCCAGPALRLLRGVLAQEHCDAPVTVRAITDEERAARYRFHGSPTILVDGVDLEGPAPDRDGYHLRCRVYAPHGECPGVPAAELIRAALYTHPGKRHPLWAYAGPAPAGPCGACVPQMRPRG
jgi:hypothetical protein